VTEAVRSLILQVSTAGTGADFVVKLIDVQRATHRIYRTSSHPSFLDVGVWKP